MSNIRFHLKYPHYEIGKGWEQILKPLKHQQNPQEARKTLISNPRKASSSVSIWSNNTTDAVYSCQQGPIATLSIIDIVFCNQETILPLWHKQTVCEKQEAVLVAHRRQFSDLCQSYLFVGVVVEIFFSFCRCFSLTEHTVVLF